ncbi:uncharacterized protein DS421_5g153410 [Arachis hypogaea]|nr:uncharacterized protein DS421_5g153410 [Arachis hypogaea]
MFNLILSIAYLPYMLCVCEKARMAFYTIFRFLLFYYTKCLLFTNFLHYFIN